MMKQLILVLGIFLALLTCGRAVSAEDKTSGQLLWEQRCSACHVLEPLLKLAPPVRGIVMNYSAKHSDKESFAVAVSDFVHSASNRQVVMTGAEQRFGATPPLPFDKGELKDIAIRN